MFNKLENIVFGLILVGSAACGEDYSILNVEKNPTTKPEITYVGSITSPGDKINNIYIKTRKHAEITIGCNVSVTNTFTNNIVPYAPSQDRCNGKARPSADELCEILDVSSLRDGLEDYTVKVECSNEYGTTTCETGQSCK